MATTAYVEDVLTLATSLRESGLGPAVYDLAPAGGDVDSVTIDLGVHAEALGPAIAAQQALQLSVDAAALYADAMAEGRELDFDYAAGLLAERPVEVVILDLSTGSFLARFSINPKTKGGRDRLLAIGGLATGALVLTGVLAPVAVTAAGGLAYLNHIFTPDAKPPAEVPLHTVDRTDAQDVRVEVKVTAPGGDTRQGTGDPRAYDIWVAGTPKAVAAFLTWVQHLKAFQGYGHFESDAEGSDRVRLWLTEPLELDLVKVAAESLGVEVIRSEVVDVP
jgi:hypothetical protein